MVYRLEGIYDGNKTYEVLGWGEVNGTKCKLVRVTLSVRGAESFLVKQFNSTSEYCFDEMGRPLAEVLHVPPGLNVSYRMVNITYAWGEGPFPERVQMVLVGSDESYLIDMERKVVVRRIGERVEEVSFSSENLSRLVPLVPAYAQEPLVELARLDLDFGEERKIGDMTIRLVTQERVQTPAGTFICLKLEVEGLTEEKLPYNSTVYVTVERPRMTVYYITDVVGIRQRGYLIEAGVPSRPSPFGNLVILGIVVLILMAAVRKVKKRGISELS